MVVDLHLDILKRHGVFFLCRKIDPLCRTEASRYEPEAGARHGVWSILALAHIGHISKGSAMIGGARAVAAVMFLLVVSLSAGAQPASSGFPNRPVRIVMPF